MIAIYDPIEDPYMDLISFISQSPLIFNVRSTLYIMCPAGPPDEMTRCLMVVGGDDDDGNDDDDDDDDGSDI
jgi:hypothetical protein